jgi:hypothetical protein
MVGMFDALGLVTAKLVVGNLYVKDRFSQTLILPISRSESVLHDSIYLSYSSSPEKSLFTMMPTQLLICFILQCI